MKANKVPKTIRSLFISCMFSVISQAAVFAQDISTDSSTVLQAIKSGGWELTARSNFMSTLNEGSLKDDYAWALGAGLAVRSRSFHGFRFKFSGYAWYNMLSSSIYQLDTQTQQSNRYEIGLFDVDGTSTKRNFSRIEESYLSYNHKNASISVGNLNLNTPFINSQDGRMRPSLEQGIWLQFKEFKKLSVAGGWLWAMLPRSTTKTYSVAKSMGIYPMGQTIDGTRANYRNNIVGCSGLALLTINYSFNEKIKVSFWNLMLENVMNTSYAEARFVKKTNTVDMYSGVLFLHQLALNNGGNANQTLSYSFKGEQANAISAQAGIKYSAINFNLNYTHITGDGRYLMPREWGREPFYTFLSRERNEGFGNLHAASLQTSLIYNKQLQFTLGYGYYRLPSVTNTRLNKYGMPSYHQVNFACNYSFSKQLAGLSIKLLLAYKASADGDLSNVKYIYNKVNMLNTSLVAGYQI